MKKLSHTSQAYRHAVSEWRTTEVGKAHTGLTIKSLQRILMIVPLGKFLHSPTLDYHWVFGSDQRACARSQEAA